MEHYFGIVRGWLGSVIRDRKAVTAMEYGMIAALIAVVIIAAVTTLGNNVSSEFNYVVTNV